MRTPFTMDSADFLQRLNRLERRFDEVVAAAALSFEGLDDDEMHPVITAGHRTSADGTGDVTADGTAVENVAADHTVADHTAADRTATHGVGAESPVAMPDGPSAPDDAASDPAAAAPRCDDVLRDPAAASVSGDLNCRTGAFYDGMFDARLVKMASELFGSTCWTSLLCVASLGFDASIVEFARQFLRRASMIIRQKGLAVWLYDLINDASMSMLLGQTSARMPMTIRPMSHAQMSRWMHGSGVKRLGTRQQRDADRAEYGNQAHRLAAHCMLRWGEPVAASAQIASMLLTNPGIGMCMLREDPNVCAQGACTDTRYRRVVDYLRSVRAQADLDYARALAAGEAPTLDPDEHTSLTLAADRRYLYDARELVRAYRTLWDRPTNDAAQLLAQVEETRTLPDEPLWENPAYLRDLADSLMGPAAAIDLVVGFELRESERFERGVRALERLCEQVRTMNVLMLPIVTLDEREPDWAAVAACGYRERTVQWRAFCDTCDDMAAVALSRLHDQGDDFRVRAAAVLLGQNLPDYCDLALPLFEEEVRRLVENERARASDGRALADCGNAAGFGGEGGEVHVDIAA